MLPMSLDCALGPWSWHRTCSACRMAGVYRFEDLRVWRAAKHQYDRVAALLDRAALRDDRALSDQMNNAALSVMLNISEGFLRRLDGETSQFLRYAFASNGELKAAYYAAQCRKYVESTEELELIALNESIARMLRRWQATLNTSDRRRGRKPSAPRTKDPGRTKNYAPSTKDSAFFSMSATVVCASG